MAKCFFDGFLKSVAKSWTKFLIQIKVPKVMFKYDLRKDFVPIVNSVIARAACNCGVASWPSLKFIYSKKATKI